MPADQPSGELALPGVPAVYLIPGLLSKTHANHTVWPADTDSGLVKLTVCQPADELTVVNGLTPSLELGEPVASP